jgi:hypothetical protein
LLGVLVVAMSAGLLAAAKNEPEVLPEACPTAAAETQGEDVSILESRLDLDVDAVELDAVGGGVPVCRVDFCLVPGTRCTFTGLLRYGKKNKLCCNYACEPDPTCTIGNGTAPPNSCPVAIPEP